MPVTQRSGADRTPGHVPGLLAGPYLTPQKSLDAALVRAGHHHTGTIRVFMFLQRQRKHGNSGTLKPVPAAAHQLSNRDKDSLVHHHQVTFNQSMGESGTVRHQGTTDSEGTCKQCYWWHLTTSFCPNRSQVKDPWAVWGWPNAHAHCGVRRGPP